MTATAGNVIYLNRPKRFTLEEARELLPRVREITQRAVDEATPIIEELEVKGLQESDRQNLSHQLNEKLAAWADEITGLGLVAKGLWLVDFDSGGGYYCWQYGEEEVSFFHGYDDGFQGRQPIQ